MTTAARTAGKFGPADLLFLVDGYNLLSNKPDNLKYMIEALTEDTQGSLGSSTMGATPTGISRVTLEQQGAFWFTDTGLYHDILAAASLTPTSTARVGVIAFGKNQIAQPFFGFAGDFLTSYEVLSKRDGLDRANVEHKINSARESGVILHEYSAETVDDATEDESVDNTAQPQVVISITSNTQASPTVVTTATPHGLTSNDTVLIAGNTGSNASINGERTVTVISSTTFSVPVNCTTAGGTGGTFTRGKTQNGGTAYLVATDITLGGYTNALVTVRHSTDDSTYADKSAFTARTTAGAERITFTGTLNRYTAQSLDLTGSGSGASFNYFVGVVRY